MTNGQKRKMKLQAASAAILAQALAITKATMEHKEIASENLKQFLIDVQALTKPLANYKPGQKVSTSTALLKIFGVNELTSGVSVTGQQVFDNAQLGEGWEKKHIRRGAVIEVVAGASYIANVYTFKGFDGEKVSARREKSKARRAKRKAEEASAVSA